ncbi:Arylacetamide deacetylase, putative [Ricinus communis]|uniref:Arylacetamide deacetylase, putative n=1 Tax=Ricinus communis TaxID=3988 RepID=B9SQS4_RICCO|nr:Arylacetamide deacetylase, putative [Ricinus communis]|eukprot:XP_002528343.1 probable carboxylesterase 18 [Ricinus communis]
MTQDLQNLDIPWKIRLSMYALCLGFDISRRSNGTINRFLMNFFDFKSFPSKKPINGVSTTDVSVDKARNLWFRLYTPTPAGDTTMPVIFYFHGGGFCYMSPHSRPYNYFCDQLARELSAIIISVNYRLAPKHRYPAQYEDCFDTIKFIDETGVEGFPSHANLKHCFLAGDSAGGNIVYHVMVRARKHEFRSIKLIGAMLIQPFFGGEERTESEITLDGQVPFVNIERTDWMWKAFLPEGSDRDHPAANVSGCNSVDISGLEFPASVIFVAGFDPLKDWQKRYYEGLKKYGKEAYLIEYPDTFHAFYAYPELPVSSLLIKDMKDFMQKQLLAANK